MKEIVEKMPTIVIERPKMPLATWKALRAHIIRERLKKKQELEQNQEFERQKKEREIKKKQEALTLEETKEQIAQLETKLADHKEEKHQLFHTLKKVLYEDETKRRSKEQVPQPHLYLLPSSRPGGSGHGPNAANHYMKPHPHVLIPPPGSAPVGNLSQGSSAHQTGGVKRSASPSPVRGTAGYYRPNSHPGLSVPGGPKFVVYTSQTGNGQLPPSSVYATASGANSSTTRAAHLPAHYSSYPGAAAASLPHGRLAEDERSKTQQLAYLTGVSSAQQAAASTNTARSIAQIQQRSTAFSSQQRAPAAHGGSGGSTTVFRAGSIVSGFPRYPASSSSGLTLTSASPRTAHSIQQPRYYQP